MSGETAMIKKVIPCTMSSQQFPKLNRVRLRVAAPCLSPGPSKPPQQCPPQSNISDCFARFGCLTLPVDFHRITTQPLREEALWRPHPHPFVTFPRRGEGRHFNPPCRRGLCRTKSLLPSARRQTRLALKHKPSRSQAWLQLDEASREENFS